MKTDFNDWTIPTKWDEVTLRQYQALEALYDGGNVDIRDVVAILANKPTSEVNELPTELFEKLLERIAFINERPEIGEPAGNITIGGGIYQINITEKLRTGEFIDAQMSLQSDKHNYALLFAILCRKAGEIYNDDYIANVLPEREKMFEEQPITKILPLVAFFLTLWKISKFPSLLSSKVEEAIDQLALDVKKYRKGGLGKALSSLSLTRKLRKLKKQIKSI